MKQLQQPQLALKAASLEGGSLAQQVKLAGEVLGELRTACDRKDKVIVGAVGNGVQAAGSSMLAGIQTANANIIHVLVTTR